MLGLTCWLGLAWFVLLSLVVGFDSIRFYSIRFDSILFYSIPSQAKAQAALTTQENIALVEASMDALKNKIKALKYATLHCYIALHCVVLC